jgi:hypothetical protein
MITAVLNGNKTNKCVILIDYVQHMTPFLAPSYVFDPRMLIFMLKS